jgi:hypothetical protein
MPRTPPPQLRGDIPPPFPEEKYSRRQSLPRSGSFPAEPYVSRSRSSSTSSLSLPSGEFQLPEEKIVDRIYYIKRLLYDMRIFLLINLEYFPKVVFFDYQRALAQQRSNFESILARIYKGDDVNEDLRQLAQKAEELYGTMTQYMTKRQCRLRISKTGDKKAYCEQDPLCKWEGSWFKSRVCVPKSHYTPDEYCHRVGSSRFPNLEQQLCEWNDICQYTGAPFSRKSCKFSPSGRAALIKKLRQSFVPQLRNARLT